MSGRYVSTDYDRNPRNQPTDYTCESRQSDVPNERPINLSFRSRALVHVNRLLRIAAGFEGDCAPGLMSLVSGGGN